MTDLSFKLETDSDHHNYSSPLKDLSLGLVSQVVLDYMHCVCLGVMRKLLLLWICGPLRIRLAAKGVRITSELFELLF